MPHQTPKIIMEEVRYDEDSIRSLDPLEHVRLRPGMYIGKLGDGSSADRWYLCAPQRSNR